MFVRIFPFVIIQTEQSVITPRITKLPKREHHSTLHQHSFVHSVILSYHQPNIKKNIFVKKIENKS